MSRKVFVCVIDANFGKGAMVMEGARGVTCKTAELRLK
ncbi:Uncharacterised protein [Yersinia aleksiciae]|uniref:Uncharacterized protein n=1 Tax=Yersinia aleksiciae TaxID=263819 RepID=A0A0T9SZE8_YERAE|nr:Uncharacterised protein [Yersinia aleksiciae]CNK52090.1 Uncharacterised protein [Yersinia aleksiciae]